MSRKTQDSNSRLLIIFGGIAVLLILIAIIARILMAPLYHEEAMAAQRGHHESHQSEVGGTNVDVNLSGLPYLLNWAMGWAWGGPGWNHGGWNNWGWNGWNGGGWNGNGRNGGWNGSVNNTVNRTFNDVTREGGGNVGRQIERNVEHGGGGNVERNVERSVEHVGGGHR